MRIPSTGRARLAVSAIALLATLSCGSIDGTCIAQVLRHARVGRLSPWAGHLFFGPIYACAVGEGYTT